MKSFKEYSIKESSIPTFKELKKDKQLMTKWTLGKKYIYGFADFLNGMSSEVKAFELIDYKTLIKFEDEDGIVYDITLILKDLDTGKTIDIDNDDRYGKYALLDKKRISNIQDKYEEAENIVNILGAFIEKM
jgi:hypothetical protein